jgi:hypothetical protein
MPYIILRGHWCNIIVLNVHAPCEDKSDDVKDSFCEELGHAFDQFPRYDMKIFLVGFNAKIDRENIFKPTINNDNGVRAVPWLRLLVACLSARRPGFAPRSIHVGFVVGKVALGQIFLRVLRFSLVNIIPPSLSKLISSGKCVIF